MYSVLVLDCFVVHFNQVKQTLNKIVEKTLLVLYTLPRNSSTNCGMLSQKIEEPYRIFRNRSHGNTLNRVLMKMNWIEVNCYKAFYEPTFMADFDRLSSTQS